MLKKYDLVDTSGHKICSTIRKKHVEIGDYVIANELIINKEHLLESRNKRKGSIIYQIKGKINNILLVEKTNYNKIKEQMEIDINNSENKE